MAKQKKTIAKQMLKNNIIKYDELQYLVHVPQQYLSSFKLRFIKRGLMKQYAQHWKIKKKQRGNSRIQLNNYQIVAYDFLISKDNYDQLFEFYYELLLRSI